MDTKNIIQRGERAKYFVKSDKWNFSFEENSYRLEIIYGMTGKKIVIPKAEFQLLNGHWLFSFPTQDIIGKVKARLVMEIFDPDCPDGLREEVDEQWIAFVVDTPCPQFLKCPKCDGKHEIIYERTEESDVGNRYARLCDRDGVPLETSDEGWLFVLRESIINNNL
jgi:hypothetical protein